MSKILPCGEIWLEIEGHLFLDIDRYRLFEAISATGSISIACQQLGIIEREARAQLQEVEQLVSFPLFREDEERRTTL